MELADLFDNVDAELRAKTLQCVGQTEIALQYFELLLAPLYAIHKHLVKNDSDLLPVYARDANWKQPLTSVVKDLAVAGRIDHDLAKRLGDYAEVRRMLVHR
jgi:hypothetical protein